MAGQGGTESQLTGDRAETKVRDVLLDAGLFCSGFEKDRGEDLLVELDGYAPRDHGAIEPRINLLQIKGHEADGEYTFKDGFAKRILRVDKLQRWAAYPLPVFVVAVNIHGIEPRFFAQSVDKIVTDVAPHGLSSLNQDSLTVQLPSVCDLPGYLTKETDSFYSVHAFKLSELSENVVARNHYEVISTKTSTVPETAKVWMKHLCILWKGPWRPAHFWATLNHIADFQMSKDCGRSTPLMASFHVYRSLKDESDNNAVAHVSWLEDEHPKSDEVRGILEWPRAKNWLRFKFNVSPNLHELPKSFAPEEADDAFLRKADSLWSQLDAISEQLISSLGEGVRIDKDLLELLESKHNSLDDYFETQVGHPSTQLTIIDKMLSQYLTTIDGALFWLKGKENVSEAKRVRWLQQDVTRLDGFYRAFGALKNVLHDG